jgi:hypothetical protein
MLQHSDGGCREQKMFKVIPFNWATLGSQNLPFAANICYFPKGVNRRLLRLNPVFSVHPDTSVNQTSFDRKSTLGKNFILGLKSVIML